MRGSDWLFHFWCMMPVVLTNILLVTLKMSVAVPFTPEIATESKSLLENPKRIEEFFLNSEAFLTSSPCFTKAASNDNLSGRQRFDSRFYDFRVEEVHYFCILHSDDWWAEISRQSDCSKVNIVVVHYDNARVRCANVQPARIKKCLDKMISGKMW